eukprot:8761894-Ditylum_brightwellii.AAC.1
MRDRMWPLSHSGIYWSVMGFNDDPVHGPAGKAHHFHQAGFSTEAVTGAWLLTGDSEETAWWRQRWRWLLLRRA